MITFELIVDRKTISKYCTFMSEICDLAMSEWQLPNDVS